MNKKTPLSSKLALSIVLGCLTGLILGKKAEFLGEVSLTIIQLLKTLAGPLVFFAILDAFCKTTIQWKQGVRLILISSINAAVAASIALSLAHLLPAHRLINIENLRTAIVAGSSTKIETAPKLNIGDTLKNLIPKNIIEPFISNQVISIVLLALIFGFAFRRLKSSEVADDSIKILESVIHGCFALVAGALAGIVEIVPFATFGILAKVVGSSGFSIFIALGYFVGIITLGILLHGGVYYSLLLWKVARVSPRHFFRQAVDPLLTAFGTGSSLATLPVTLKTLQDIMKIPARSARLAAVVGTNLNHDGILLYEAAAALFIAQVMGISLGFEQQMLLVGISTLAAVGIGGVPDAGLITLSLVFSTVGLPLEAVPLLLPVDWFIGRLRATSNVTSDMVVAHLLHRFDPDENHA